MPEIIGIYYSLIAIATLLIMFLSIALLSLSTRYTKNEKFLVAAGFVEELGEFENICYRKGIVSIQVEELNYLTIKELKEKISIKQKE